MKPFDQKKKSKTNKKLFYDLGVYARKRNLLIIYLNNLKYIKIDKDFFLEPDLQESMGEYMNNILVIDYYENSKNKDEYILRVVKSKLTDGEEFLLKFSDTEMIVN